MSLWQITTGTSMEINILIASVLLLTTTVSVMLKYEPAELNKWVAMAVASTFTFSLVVTFASLVALVVTKLL